MKAWARATIVSLFLASGCDGGASGERDGGQPAGPYAGDWLGLTSQSKPIAFRVEGNVVTYLRLEYELSGGSCNISGKEMRDTTAPITNGAFTIGVSYADSSSVVAGTFASGSAATGSFSGTSSSICTATGEATWQAEKLPLAPSYDGTWAGQTSQGKSISIVVSDNLVTSLELGYTMSNACVTTATFSGKLAGSGPILAGQAEFSHGKSPVMISGDVTFSGAGPATGSVNVSYFDSTSQPPCTGSVTPTFSLERQ